MHKNTMKRTSEKKYRLKFTFLKFFFFASKYHTLILHCIILLIFHSIYGFKRDHLARPKQNFNDVISAMTSIEN